MTVDLALHLGEVITVVGAVCTAAWRVIRAAGKVEDMLENFPPHRHVNGSILYPKGYEPTEVGHLPAGIN